MSCLIFKNNFSAYEFILDKIIIISWITHPSNRSDFFRCVWNDPFAFPTNSITYAEIQKPPFAKPYVNGNAYSKIKISKTINLDCILLFCDTNIGYVFFTPTVEYSLNTETCKFLHIKTEILTANFLPILFVLNHWEFATNQSLLVYKGSA